MKAARRLTSAALSVVRRGPAEILWTPDEIGFGNYLYLWLWAHAGEAEGVPRRVLHKDSMDPWLERIPRLRRYVATRDAVGFSDIRRVTDFSIFEHRALEPRPQNTFRRDQLDAFIREVLLAEGVFADLPQRAAARDPQAVAVHVRRGTYYTVPEFRGDYSIDFVAYAQEAVARAQERSAISRFEVYSNDPRWCETRLAWLADVAPLEVVSGARTDVDDFADLSAARRLVLANSTFSYWAGYISGVLHEDRGGDRADIIAPWFHCRRFLDGRAWHLDPRWTVVDEIDGGWDA